MHDYRRLSLVALGLATALLGAGAWLAQSGLQRLALQRQQSAQWMQGMQQARALMPEVEQRERLARSISDLDSQARRLGVDPAHWASRRLRQPQGVVTRVAAADFLNELAQAGTGAIFVADAFDIAMQSAGAGLFHAPQTGDEGVTLGASGTLYFQTARPTVAGARP